jgi:predicted nuclease with TOPRIM domain
MSKTRNKNHSELEHVRGQLKAVRRENRQLKKRIKQLERRAHFYEETIDEIAEDIDLDICPSCKKAPTTVIDLKYLIIEKCTQCDYESRIKPNAKKAK